MLCQIYFREQRREGKHMKLKIDAGTYTDAGVLVGLDDEHDMCFEDSFHHILVRMNASRT